jgi:hypothetical protein
VGVTGFDVLDVMHPRSGSGEAQRPSLSSRREEELRQAGCNKELHEKEKQEDARLTRCAVEGKLWAGWLRHSTSAAAKQCCPRLPQGEYSRQ